MSTCPHRLAARCVPAAIITAAALALSGCAADAAVPAPATPSAPPAAALADPPATAVPAEQTVAWTNRVCGALVPVAQDLAAPPALELGDPATTKQAYVTYLADAQAATDRALNEVSAAGAAPVDDGAAVADDVRTDLTALRDDLGDARAKLEKAESCRQLRAVRTPAG